jgi:hypothetical protein
MARIGLYSKELIWAFVMSSSQPRNLVAIALLAGLVACGVPAQPSASGAGFAALPDGDTYRVCSQPPVEGADAYQVVGHCLAFRKTGDRVVGNFYDTETLGEVGLCVSGTLSDNTVQGEAIEFIGSVGNPKIPDNSEGTALVNWDDDGFLQVAQARVIAQEEQGEGTGVMVDTVQYGEAVLTLDGFHRHPDAEVPAPTDCTSTS